MIIILEFLSLGEIYLPSSLSESVPKRDSGEPPVVPFRGSAKPVVFRKFPFLRGTFLARQVGDKKLCVSAL